MKIPSHSDIEFLGFVSSEEKLQLMAGATVYMMPSKNESLSIVTLEAMAQSTPVLANGGSGVLVDHIKHSGAGRIRNRLHEDRQRLGHPRAKREHPPLRPPAAVLLSP